MASGTSFLHGNKHDSRFSLQEAIQMTYDSESDVEGNEKNKCHDSESGDYSSDDSQHSGEGEDRSVDSIEGTLCFLGFFVRCVSEAALLALLLPYLPAFSPVLASLLAFPSCLLAFIRV